MLLLTPAYRGIAHYPSRRRVGTRAATARRLSRATWPPDLDGRGHRPSTPQRHLSSISQAPGGGSPAAHAVVRATLCREPPLLLAASHGVVPVLLGEAPEGGG
jgi:hypothetical protein